MENQMDMENIFGGMEATIRENLKMALETEKGYGKKIQAQVINMKDSM